MSRLVPHRVICILSAVALLAASPGCSKRKEASSGSPAVVEAPPPPPGDPVGHKDARLNAAAPNLAEWVTMWRAADPRFQPDSLYFAGESAAFRGGYVQPLNDFDPPSPEGASIMDVLAADSPDDRYKLVFDHYQGITDDDGDVDIAGDADSAPLLLDRNQGISNRFEFCGPSCGFHWGAWLSPTSFVLAGWEEPGPTQRWTRGRVTIYSIPDSSSASYVTRAMSAEDFDRYRSAWKQWVVARYHAYKAKHAAS
jgi:hypothetical protein